MLWYCRFTWAPGTSRQMVRERVARQHAAGTNHPEKIRGWYNLVGGGAGFMLVEAEEPRELTPMLEPYMDLVSWDVHGVYPLAYDEMLDHLEREFMSHPTSRGFADVPADERRRRAGATEEHALDGGLAPWA